MKLLLGLGLVGAALVLVLLVMFGGPAYSCGANHLCPVQSTWSPEAR